MTYKRFRTFLLLILCLSFAFPALSHISVLAEEVDVEENKLNAFQVEIDLDTDSQKLLVKQRLDYRNSTGVGLSDIYFNVYPPAFQDVGGDTEFSSVKVAGMPVSLSKVETTVYRMPLPATLAAAEELLIEMEYVVSIPDIENRFGRQDHVYNLGNVIVMPAVYGASGWASNPYIDLGDAFHSELADFTVSIKVPEGYSVAASGAKNEDGLYVARRVRDFAFCASDRFKTKTASVGDIEVTVFYLDDIEETATRVLETCERALLLFNEAFSVYPYETLRVVLSVMTSGVSGMEYPTLIMVGSDMTVEKMKADGLPLDQVERNGIMHTIDKVVVHEIAHQWFYGIVGNDQINHGWIDEGMCRFAEYLYEKAYPPETPQPDYVYFLANYLAAAHKHIDSDDGIGGVDLAWSLYEWQEYAPDSFAFLYTKGASLIYQMEQKMGEAAFAEALKEYVEMFAYDFVTPEKFQTFWQTKDDFQELFKQYFSTIEP